jgi:hypothetical protein
MKMIVSGILLVIGAGLFGVGIALIRANIMERTIGWKPQTCGKTRLLRFMHNVGEIVRGGYATYLV